MNSADKQDNNNTTKFEVIIFRLIRIKTEGYKPEDNQKLIETITKPKRLWFLMICLILLVALAILSGGSAWNILKDSFNPP